MKNIAVITAGYYGFGSSVFEAATNCKKAGSPANYPATVWACGSEVALERGYVVYDHKAGVTKFKVKRLGALLIEC